MIPVRLLNNPELEASVQAAQDLRDLDIKEMWGVKRLARRAQTCSNLAGVDVDYRVSRSLRTASAGEMRGETRERRASRLKISSPGGRSTSLRASRIR